MPDLALYTYFRSSAAYRVRIALRLKGLDAQMHPVNLLNDEQLRDGFDAVHPQRMIPVLDDEHRRLHQSLAILEYLDETYPAPPLMPSDPGERARVRAMAQIIACDIHPLNTPRVTKYLTAQFGVNEEAKLAWICHWIADGLAALETMLEQPETGGFCHGNAPSIADCCLIPQVYNAQRFGCSLEPYPLIRRIHAHCMEYTAFQEARPERQLDTPPELRG